MAHDSNQTTKKLIAVKKASSLLAKINHMIEEDAYCIDIMQQNLAVIGILRSLHKTLMEDHLNHCVRHALIAKDVNKQQQMIQEIMAVTNLFNK